MLPLTLFPVVDRRIRNQGAQGSIYGHIMYVAKYLTLIA